DGDVTGRLAPPEREAALGVHVVDGEVRARLEVLEEDAGGRRGLGRVPLDGLQEGLGLAEHLPVLPRPFLFEALPDDGLAGVGGGVVFQNGDGGLEAGRRARGEGRGDGGDGVHDLVDSVVGEGTLAGAGGVGGHPSSTSKTTSSVPTPEEIRTPNVRSSVVKLKVPVRAVVS